MTLFLIKTIKQFSAYQKSGKSCVTFLDKDILTHGPEEDILLLLDGLETYFGNPIKGMFYANMLDGIGNEFLQAFHTLFDVLNIGGCAWTKNKFKKQ